MNFNFFNLKNTVDVTLSDSPFTEWHAWFTTVIFIAFSDYE